MPATVVGGLVQELLLDARPTRMTNDERRRRRGADLLPFGDAIAPARRRQLQRRHPEAAMSSPADRGVCF